MNLHQNFIPVNASQQDLGSFDCGEEMMNEFLSQSSGTDMVHGKSLTFVLPIIKEGIMPGSNARSPIAAYYTITQAQVKPNHLIDHPELSGRFPLPVYLLARLAVDKSLHRKGLGELALITALKKYHELMSSTGIGCGLILDVLNEESMKFYERFETFEKMTGKGNSKKLFISNSTVEEVINPRP